MNVIQQGKFTSKGEKVELQIRSDVTWMEVYNQTQYARTQASGRAVQFYWQSGLSPGEGFFKQKINNGNTLEGNFLTSGGFTLLDTSASPDGALKKTISAISTANPPVATNTGANGLVAKDVVRIINVTDAKQLGGFDFTVGIGTLSGTTFSLDFMTALAQAGTSGSFRKIKFDSQFYPSTRFITEISKASQAVITLSVLHEYTKGEKLRLVVPKAYGMTEADNKIVTVLDTNMTNNTITVDLDTSSFDTFAFPAHAAYPFTPAITVPYGKSTLKKYENMFMSTTKNRTFIGILLEAGTTSPAGSNNDVIYWKAGSVY